MSRGNNENNRQRGIIFETAKLAVGQILAIAANQTLASGMPYTLAYDPAATSRNVIMYTPAVPSLQHEHEIINIGTGAGALVIKAIDTSTTIGTLNAGERALVRYINATLGWMVFKMMGQGAVAGVGARYTASLYVLYSSIANTHAFGIKIPHAFTLRGVGLRSRLPVTTGAKAATLTAQINGVSTTGGVISATSAGQTPTNTRQDGTTITALNTGTADQVVSVLASAVTAFSEGDGYIEFDLTNNGL